METGRRVGRKWLSCGIAWGLLFAALAMVLPPSPAFRFTGLAPLRVEGFTDPQTLIVSLAPPQGPVAPRSFALMDLERGTLRRLELPSAPVEEGENPSSSLPGRRPPPGGTPLFGPGTPPPPLVLSESRHPRGYLDCCRVVGERLVLLDLLVDQVRVSLWNSRTGEQVAERTYPWCDTWVLGERLAIEWREAETGRARLDLLDLATGAIVPSPLPAEQVSLARGQASIDGRYFVERFKPGRIRVWSLDSGQELFRAEADRFGFSPDGRLLASVAAPRRRSLSHRPKPRPVGASSALGDDRPTLRIHETATGQLLAEHLYHTTTPVWWLDEEATLSFHDEGRCVAITGEDRRCNQPEIYLWNWQESRSEKPSDPIVAPREIRREPGRLIPPRVDGPPARRHADTPAGAGEPLGLIVADDEVIDAKSGDWLSTLPGQWVNGTSGWGIVRSRRQSPSDDIADAIAPWSGLLAAAISHRGEPLLCDLATGRRIVWLGDDVAGLRFSPDARWLVTQRPDSLDVWSLPPHRPWLQALGVSLAIIVPFLCSRIWKRRRGEPQEGAPGP